MSGFFTLLVADSGDARSHRGRTGRTPPRFPA
jgi:hypothetical protein